ncbi:MAG TPA: rod shape-determining protein MreC [Candidatus Acidoferrales bacterium]|nr:rod shape-determining protein MreC [Candidatus Acidoferrales bacterium]
MDVPSRNRPFVLLVAVILAQVLLLAFQIKRGQDVRLIRVWSAELLTPPQRAGTFVISKIDSTWFGYIDLRHTRAENRQLTTEVGLLRLKNEQLEGQAAEAGRLAKLLGFRQANSSVPTVAAEVIGASADSNSQTIFINRGASDGLRRNMAVVTPDGVVGKIFEVLPHMAQVLLVTDKESGVGALLANTRTHGVVKGTGDPLLWMDYVTAGEKVPVGEEILTSGEDRIFPKDLPVGTVVSMKPGSPIQTIKVKPAAHLDRLEEVLVLLTEQSLKARESDAAAGSAAPETKSPSDKAQGRAAKIPKSAVTTKNTAGATKNAAPATNHAKTPVKTPAPLVKKPAAAAKPGGTSPAGARR